MKNAILREVVCFALTFVGTVITFSQVVHTGPSYLAAAAGVVILSAGTYIRGRTYR